MDITYFIAIFAVTNLKSDIMTNLILSIRPEAAYSFVLVLGFIILNIFVLIKFFQIAGDVRKISNTLESLTKEVKKIGDKI